MLNFAFFLLYFEKLFTVNTKQDFFKKTDEKVLFLCYNDYMKNKTAINRKGGWI